MNSQNHNPVMLKECIDALNIDPNGTYVDGTFGRGGHSQYILKHLSSQGQLIAFDQDLQAIEYGKKLFANDNRVRFINANFALLKEKLLDNGIKEVNGILFDFGVSSPQLDNAERGFSFNKSGPLDMRMNQNQGESAKDWLHRASVREISRVLKIYGEEKFSDKIARNIVAFRNAKEITDTLELATIVENSIPEKFKYKNGKPLKRHLATKTFQGIRIHINDELRVIEKVLPQSIECLKNEGRLAIMSFHSLEDRLVKRFMQKHTKSDNFPIDLPITHDMVSPLLSYVGKRITAEENEVSENARSRSATLRVVKKNREATCNDSL